MSYQLIDNSGRIVWDTETEETRHIHACYRLVRHGLDFHEWLKKPLAECESKVKELEAKPEKPEKAKKSKFDPKSPEFVKFCTADERYVAMAKRAKEGAEITTEEKTELFKALKRDFLAKKAA